MKNNSFATIGMTGIILLFLIPIITGVTYQKGQLLDLKIGCSIDGSRCSDSATCTANIQFPNGSYLRDNVSLLNLGNGEFNITILAGELSHAGTYQGRSYCIDGLYNGTISFEFDVTGTGFEFTQSKSNYYIALLFFLIFLFLITLFSVSRLPNKDDTDNYGLLIGINKLKYLRPVLFLVAWVLLLSMVYTSSNVALAYLGAEMFGQLLLTIYKIMFVLTLPIFIIWFIFLIVQIFRDNETKKMLERGIDIPAP